MAGDSKQTTFSWGQPHHSEGHAGHQHGSQAPVQKDFQIRNPDGNVRESVGVGFIGQTTLPMFKGFK